MARGIGSLVEREQLRLAATTPAVAAAAGDGGRKATGGWRRQRCEEQEPNRRTRFAHDTHDGFVAIVSQPGEEKENRPKPSEAV